MGKKFTFGATPVAKIAEEIRNEEPANIQQPVNDIQSGVNEQSTEINTQHSTLNNKKPIRSAKKQADIVDGTAEDKPVTGKKTDVGVTIQLPKKYYRLLRDIKDETGIALRDLALNAVIEYVDNYEFEE